MKNIDNIRTNYSFAKLTKNMLSMSPIHQFKKWFGELSQLDDFNAMILSTYTLDEGVSNRVVLLKEVTHNGFVFYTNYTSLKARQIDANNKVALCFFWPTFQRQVRINGVAVKVPKEKSDMYFNQRPRESQIAAWISLQSEIITKREDFEKKYTVMDLKFKNKKIPRPDFWGGYEVIPFAVEFWQGRVNRMHDRFLYQKKDNKWIINRLAP